jgi:DNA-binding response OmpR family regulator
MKKCVFVLEDNDEIRELFTYLLEEESYEVHAYPTAASFRESLEHSLPDLLVLDVMLPDGNGLDICCELKEDPKTESIPIIIMSAHAEISDMKKKCEAEEFIAKPFDIQNFIDKVQKHI